MSGLITAVVVLLCIATYGGITGATMSWAGRALKNRCEGCRKETDYWIRCNKDHGSGALFTGLLWPVGIPAVLGFMHQSKDDREAQARHKELAEAEHRVKMAEQLARENRALDRMLDTTVEADSDRYIQVNEETIEITTFNGDVIDIRPRREGGEYEDYASG